MSMIDRAEVVTKHAKDSGFLLIVGGTNTF